MKFLVARDIFIYLQEGWPRGRHAHRLLDIFKHHIWLRGFITPETRLNNYIRWSLLGNPEDAWKLLVESEVLTVLTELLPNERSRLENTSSKPSWFDLELAYARKHKLNIVAFDPPYEVENLEIRIFSVDEFLKFRLRKQLDLIYRGENNPSAKIANQELDSTDNLLQQDFGNDQILTNTSNVVDNSNRESDKFHFSSGNIQLSNQVKAVSKKQRRGSKAKHSGPEGAQIRADDVDKLTSSFPVEFVWLLLFPSLLLGNIEEALAANETEQELTFNLNFLWYLGKVKLYLNIEGVSQVIKINQTLSVGNDVQTNNLANSQISAQSENNLDSAESSDIAFLNVDYTLGNHNSAEGSDRSPTLIYGSFISEHSVASHDSFTQGDTAKGNDDTLKSDGISLKEKLPVPSGNLPIDNSSLTNDEQGLDDGTGITDPNADTGGPDPDNGTGGTDPDDGASGTDPDDGIGGTDLDDGTSGTDPDNGTGGTNPDDGTGVPDPDDGTGGTDSDNGGTGGTNPDDGTGVPNPDDGTGGTNPDDGTGVPNPDDGTGGTDSDNGGTDPGTGSGNAKVDDGSGVQKEIPIDSGDGQVTVNHFGGVGEGINPSQQVRSEADTLKLEGEGLDAASMLLTEQGDDLVITFEGVETLTITLPGLQLEELDNLRKDTGATVDIGNILFNGDEMIEDSFDVIDADANLANVLRANKTTFLNNLDNQTQGFDGSADIINGQDGNDRLNGLSGDDILRGGNGNDILLGGADSDRLVGDAGDDLLDGGSGHDTLQGGSGRDRFILRSDTGIATITDFQIGEDMIEVASNISLNQLSIIQTGSDTTIQLGNQTLAILQGMQSNDIVQNAAIYCLPHEN
jgi:hypothetical protein